MHAYQSAFFIIFHEVLFLILLYIFYFVSALWNTFRASNFYLVCCTVHYVSSLEDQVALYPISVAESLMDAIKSPRTETTITIISGVITDTDMTAIATSNLFCQILEHACKNKSLLLLALYCPVCEKEFNLYTAMSLIPDIVIKKGPVSGQWPHQYVRVQAAFLFYFCFYWILTLNFDGHRIF